MIHLPLRPRVVGKTIMMATSLHHQYIKIMAFLWDAFQVCTQVRSETLTECSLFHIRWSRTLRRRRLLDYICTIPPILPLFALFHQRWPPCASARLTFALCRSRHRKRRILLWTLVQYHAPNSTRISSCIRP